MHIFMYMSIYAYTNIYVYMNLGHVQMTRQNGKMTH